MIFLLSLLLLICITGLGFLAYAAMQLRISSALLESEISTQRTRHAEDQKSWNDSTTSLKAKIQSVVSKYNDNVKRWNELFKALKEENHKLAKWKNVADAESQATRLREEAVAISEQAKSEATNLLSEAQSKVQELEAKANSEADTLLADAKKASKQLTAESRGLLDSTTLQVAKMLDAANKKANDIAGNAYQAMKDASAYEQAVKAMKNLIEGYGDQYLIPPQNLLDEMAEDFSHLQAGQELKRARECVRAMVQNKTAATCDYAEANRRETAINFVVDAFNGKVDSILSKAKHDNSGKLTQQVRDAFALVNLNGKAFREARITDEYLDARLDELKWVVIVQQLALKDREEQREAKEQAREETRAAKEIERALRDAAKEEGILQKAMEQAKEQVEHATGEQRSMYEARLQEMEQRLREAAERKDRAKSMAEQTKKGHVYIISNIGSFGEDVIKIGLTRRWDPIDRINELGGASVPFGFDVHAMIVSDDAPALEQQLHEHFMLQQVNKVNHRKEFFRASISDIRQEIDKLGYNGVSWTMTALAKEYRETLVTEKKIAESSLERERWISRQQRLELEAGGTPELAGALADDE